MDAYIQIVSYTGTTTRIGVKRVTSKAVLVEIADGAFEWFPLSQVRFFITDSCVVIVMPLWMARQKGFSTGRYNKVVDVDSAVRDGRATEIFVVNEDGSVNTDAVIMI